MLDALLRMTVLDVLLDVLRRMKPGASEKIYREVLKNGPAS